MSTHGFHLPEDSPLAAQIKKRAKDQHDGKVSAYVRSLVERDLAGETPDATSPTIIADLCRRLRGEIAAQLSGALATAHADQPAILATFLEALSDLLRRKPGASLDSFALLEGSAVSELQLLANSHTTPPEAIREKLGDALGPPPKELLRFAAIVAEHAAQYLPKERQAIDTERALDDKRDRDQGKGSRRSSAQ